MENRLVAAEGAGGGKGGATIGGQCVLVVKKRVTTSTGSTRLQRQSSRK